MNVPELMQQFRQVADVQTAEMLKLPVPKLEQGRPVTVSAPTTPELKRFVDQLVKRTEKIKSGRVDPRDDNMLIREDLRARSSTRGDNFSMVVKNETFTDRAKAGRAIVFIAAAMRPFQSTKAIGNAGGFAISIHKLDERANLTIHGKNSYSANVSDSALGTIASVEHALESMEDRLRERESDIKQYRKQSEDLTKQLDHPFEHEEKLTVATTRQQEIVTALDITKNQASAMVSDFSEESVEVAQEKTGPKMANNAAARTSQGVTV